MRKLKILVVGVGGLGCPASLALAEAGVDTLGLMDPDKVELSNLHRQILYSDKDLGRPKVEAAGEYLKTHYPQTKTILIPEAFGAGNAEKYLKEYDLIIDGLDRLEKKFFLNDWCVKLKKPFVHAGVVKFEGQVLPVMPGQTACLRCLIPKIPPPFAMPTCQEAGVLGSFSQAIGYLQAHEGLKLARGKGASSPMELAHLPVGPVAQGLQKSSNRGPRHEASPYAEASWDRSAQDEGPFRLWKIDAQKRETRSIVPQRDPHCAACGKGRVEEKIVEPACAK